MSSLNRPEDIERMLNALSRRDFLKLGGAAGALALLASCRNRLPPEMILPYQASEAARDAIVGEARHFASTFPFAGLTQGILVTSHEGRPTKIEGHPNHPASFGATHVFAQAALMDLYSPHRLTEPLRRNAGTTWNEFATALQSSLKEQPGMTALLTPEIVSPTLARQIQTLSAGPSPVRHFVHQPVNHDAAYAGLRLATGEPLEAIVDYERAERVLALDCDFLYTEPGAVRHARAWKTGDRRHAKRLYVLEPSVTVTGTQADHRWALSRGEIQAAALAIESWLHKGEGDPKWKGVADDLREYRGRSAIVVGFAQNPEIHALAHRLNAKLGNIGTTIQLRRPASANQVDQLANVRELTQLIAKGQVQRLLIFGGNPAFDLPKDLGFRDAIPKAPFTAHLTLFPNETSQLTAWALPESHFLESWSDAVSHDGTTSLIQPLITPLYASRSAHEVLALLSSEAALSGYEIVRATWSQAKTGAESKGVTDFDRAWREALQRGYWSLGSNARTYTSPRLKESTAVATPEVPKADEIEIEFRPDPSIWDGTFAENPWLQELPKVQSQTTWDNALWISTALARAKSVKSGDRVLVETPHGSLSLAAFVVEGLPERTLTLHLGYGREVSGPVAEGAGFNAQSLRSGADRWHARVQRLEKLEGTYEIATTQQHHTMDGREILRSIALTGTAAQRMEPPTLPDSAREGIGEGGMGSITEPRLINPNEQWAMTIDLDSCIGCSACVIACQVENNIPAVGKKLVLMGREMHWIRIDRYVPQTHGGEGSRDLSAASAPQPITCMQCETAPCEEVCPVQATAHSSDGLNQMTYNRCVGTRYCSNNCPYKVRRFNFFDYTAGKGPQLEMARNPDVTVRSRGVMEKCTYCVQRIESARIRAGKEQRAIRDGEIVTACAQACPTEAITFGNLKDTKSHVVLKRKDPRTYGLLVELGTRPRTTYLARVTNPNPEIPS